MENKEKRMEVANTIVKQLGNTMLNLIGAHNLIAEEKGMNFRFKGSNKANCLKITLEPTDTYKLEFIKIHGLNVETVKEFDGVYFDMLHEIFESVTGLYTHF